MILVLLMRKLVMLDKIHRTNLYFVRYTNVIIKNISIYQGEQNLGEKRQNSLMEFFKVTSSGICLFLYYFGMKSRNHTHKGTQANKANSLIPDTLSIYLQKIAV